MSAREERLASHHPGETEIAQLHIVGGIEEHVRRLEVTMQNGALLSHMAFLQGESHLQENLPDDLLVDAALLTAALLNVCREVTAGAVLHHDEDLGLLFVYYSIIVPDNVWMVQFSKNIDLRDELLLLFLIHLSIV